MKQPTKLDVLSNAIKAARAGHRVTIAANADRTEWSWFRADREGGLEAARAFGREPVASLCPRLVRACPTGV